MTVKKVLATLRGALGASDKFIDTITEGRDSEASIKTIRNLIIMGKIIASVDPLILDGIANAVSETLGNRHQEPEKAPGLLAILHDFSSANLRRSLGLINRFLNSLGSSLRQHRLK
jgi:uncharacterized protein YjgD (DUF1641 family)